MKDFLTFLQIGTWGVTAQFLAQFIFSSDYFVVKNSAEAIQITLPIAALISIGTWLYYKGRKDLALEQEREEQDRKFRELIRRIEQ